MDKAKVISFNIIRGALVLFTLMALFNLVVFFTVSKQNVKVSKQDTYTSGGSGGCQISVVNTKNTEPLQAKIKINLLDSKKRLVKKLLEGKTDEKGLLTANFEIPKVKDEGEHFLEIKASSKSGSDKILEKINVLSISSANKVTINLDKLLYKPGDEVNYRALLTNNNDDRPIKTDAVVTILDGNENRVYSKSLSSSEYGIVNGKLQLADQVNSGTYKIKVEVGKTSSEKLFEVKPYVMPKFKAIIDTDKKEYLVGELIKGKITANYFFGQPVKGGKAAVKLNEQSPKEISLNASGEGQFSYQVNTKGIQTISADITDISNFLVEETKTVFSGKDKINVKIIPENKELIPGIENEVYIFTSKIDGTPIKTYITLKGDKTKQIATDGNGFAKFTVTPDYTDYSYNASANGYQYKLSAKISNESVDVVIERDFTIPIHPNNAGLIVRSDKPLYSVNEKISLDINSNLDGALTQLYISKNGQILKMVNVTGDNAEIELPKDTYGLIDIYAEKQGNFREYRGYYTGTVKANCSRAIFIKPDKKMVLAINKDNRVYKPGEDLQLSFDVKDDKNNPLNSAIFLSIADEAMLALRDNDMSLDNLRLALSGVDFQEIIKGIDLYTAILNNAHPTALTALLLGRNTGYPGLKESNSGGNNVMKKQNTWENLLKWFMSAIAFLIVLLMVKFRWFRFAVLHFLGFMLIFAGLILGIIFLSAIDALSINNNFLVFIILAIAAMMLYTSIINKISLIKTEKKILINPVGSGIALAVLIMFGLITLNYLMSSSFTSMFNQSGTLIGGDVDGIGPTSVMESVKGSASRNTDDESQMMNVGGLHNPFEGLFATNKNSQEQSINSELSDTNANQVVRVQEGQKKPEELAEIKRIRTKFLESMYFNPQIIAQDGKASIKVPLADNITTWRIQAVGNSTGGNVGYENDSVKVFQDFFVDFELPRNLTVGDEVSIPVTVFNYLKNTQDVKLNIKTSDWFSMLDANDQRVSVGANQQKLVYVPIKVNKFGDYSLRVSAFGQEMSDAVDKEVKVYPNGYKLEEVCTSGKIDKKADEQVFFLDKDIEGTRKVRVKLYPTPLAQVVEGLENIIRFPSGCFEQTSSSLYPDILVLKYLKDTKKSKPEIEDRANGFIETGFQRLLTYEVKRERGGFSLYGNSPAETVLTAYGLMEFNDLKEVYPVDQNIIDRMKEFIFKKQKFDGSFEITGYHAGGAGSTDNLALNAYIGWALSESCKDDPRFNKTVGYLKKKAFDTEDSYTLALIANVLVNAKDNDAKKVLDKLVNKVTIDNDQNAYLVSKARDYYGAYGNMQNLQTTALASMALSAANVNPKTNKQLISYIISQKDAGGTFGSTQATILSLKALVANSKNSVPRDDTVKITVNGVEEQVVLKADNFLSFYEKEFANLGKDNTVTLKANTDLTYEIVKEHYLPYDQAKIGDEFDISRTMKDSVKVNDEVIENIKITNKQQAEVANLMVTIQIPQGFTLDEQSLERLKKKGLVEKYEMGYDELNLYLRNFQTYEMKSLDIKMRARYPVKVTTGAIHVYDYYNPDVEAKLKPINIQVQP